MIRNKGELCKIPVESSEQSEVRSGHIIKFKKIIVLYYTFVYTRKIISICLSIPENREDLILYTFKGCVYKINGTLFNELL